MRSLFWFLNNNNNNSSNNPYESKIGNGDELESENRRRRKQAYIDGIQVNGVILSARCTVLAKCILDAKQHTKMAEVMFEDYFSKFSKIFLKFQY